MKIQQAEDKIKQAGGNIEDFHEWMDGQTVGLNEDGTVDYYDYDVDRFISYKCNPKNETVGAWD